MAQSKTPAGTFLACLELRHLLGTAEHLHQTQESPSSSTALLQLSSSVMDRHEVEVEVEIEVDDDVDSENGDSGKGEEPRRREWAVEMVAVRDRVANALLSFMVGFCFNSFWF